MTFGTVQRWLSNRIRINPTAPPAIRSTHTTKRCLRHNAAHRLRPSLAGPALPDADPNFGIVQRRLSNGIRVNYCKTDHEPKAALLRLIAPGGRACEKMEIGPDGFGAIVLGGCLGWRGGWLGWWLGVC